VLTLCIVAVHCWNTDFKVYLILKQIKSPTINLGLFPVFFSSFFWGLCVCWGGGGIIRAFFHNENVLSITISFLPSPIRTTLLLN
jgi:hypothetical protein